MAASSRYRALGQSLKRLQKNHLGFRPRVTSGYTERELSQAAAYTIFAHGEFESFLEDWATEIINVIARKGFVQGFSPMLGYLISYSKQQPLTIPTQIPTTNLWPTLAGNSVSNYRAVIRNNHGISERYICALLIPLGVDVTAIDSVLISDLAAFSKIRGDHAHQSRQRHLNQQFDPFDRLSKVQNIYSLLLTLDTQLQTHLKSC